MKLDTKNGERRCQKVILSGFSKDRESARRSPLHIVLSISVPKKCGKFTRENPCRSVISTKLESNFYEFTLQHRCSFERSIHELLTSLDVKIFTCFTFERSLTTAQRNMQLQKSSHHWGSSLFIIQLALFTLARLSYTLLPVPMQHFRFNLTPYFREIMEV